MRHKAMILEGVLAIQAGLNPRVIEQKLKAFYPRRKSRRWNVKIKRRKNIVSLFGRPPRECVMARNKKDGGSSGANWMDTYGDMVTLLLTFFVFLYSASSISEQSGSPL